MDNQATKQARPRDLTGKTQRIQTAYGKLYININDDEDGDPFEIFVTTGNSGGFLNGLLEALAKSLSIGFRCGIDPLEFADDFIGIRSPKIAQDNNDVVYSIPDAIGIAIYRHMFGIIEDNEFSRYTFGETVRDENGDSHIDEPRELTVEEAINDRNNEVAEPTETVCPECNSTRLRISEGCKTCGECGWSEC